MNRSVLATATLATAVLLGACTADPEPGTNGSSGEAASPAPAAGELLSRPDDGTEAPEPLIDTDDLIAGGPPPDGIPPIDQPEFQPVGEVDWLADEEPVLSLTVEGETKAYPLQIMTWHEIVNDFVGDVPVAVTYCPLCNSGVAFERTVDGERLNFGTSGLLYADNLVMYDRQTRSLWPQLTGLASVGELTGTQLVAIPMGVTGFGQFREAHPDALVLTRETGHSRPYGQNPYEGYDEPDGDLLFEPPDGLDARLPVKERVIGISIGDLAVAVRRDAVAEDAVLELAHAGQDLVVWHRPGQRSALDEGTIAKGRDIGTVGVFDPEVRGRKLSFVADGSGFRDTATDSRWNVLGQAVSGPLEGRSLEPVTHLDTFWFAWVAFQPETTLYP